MNALERRMVNNLLAKHHLTVDQLPPEGRKLYQDITHDTSAGARAWIERHPDEDAWPWQAYACCSSAAIYGPRRCECWEPVYDVDQANPQLPKSPEDLGVQPRMCGDCAYRKGSPERDDDYLAGTLLELAVSQTPFWCHTGMRRPVVYRHRDLGDVPADPADYTPPMVAGVPFQADGTPGLLCAGWSVRAAREAGT